jgi:hypothetical protein
MSLLLTRIELHNVVLPAYSNVHEAMKKIFFTREITMNDGSKRILPRGEYVSTVYNDPDFAMRKIEGVINSFDAKAEITLAICESIRVRNLTLVKETNQFLRTK